MTACNFKHRLVIYLDLTEKSSDASIALVIYNPGLFREFPRNKLLFNSC